MLLSSENTREGASSPRRELSATTVDVASAERSLDSPPGPVASSSRPKRTNCRRQLPPGIVHGDLALALMKPIPAFSNESGVAPLELVAEEPQLLKSKGQKRSIASKSRSAGSSAGSSSIKTDSLRARSPGPTFSADAVRVGKKQKRYQRRSATTSQSPALGLSSREEHALQCLRAVRHFHGSPLDVFNSKTGKRSIAVPSTSSSSSSSSSSTSASGNACSRGVGRGSTAFDASGGNSLPEPSIEKNIPGQRSRTPTTKRASSSTRVRKTNASAAFKAHGGPGRDRDYSAVPVLGQLEQRSCEVIDVRCRGAAERVRDARRAGAPVVLVGHVGEDGRTLWPGFADDWVTKRAKKGPQMKPQSAERGKEISLGAERGRPRESKKGIQKGEGTEFSPMILDDSDEEQEIEGSDEFASFNGSDRSSGNESVKHEASFVEYELKVEQLLSDIGDEEVPVVQPEYDAVQPIKHNMKVRDFVAQSWLPGNTCWYMHQWQFPLSDQVGTTGKLCHRTTPLDSVLGEDLTQFWLDRCRDDSPFQYIFFGHRGTVTKIHRDNGGLAITITALTGAKECILVHRDDATCLYRCAVDVKAPDLLRHPMFAFARVWRHVLRPGEILFLPAGTYHYCRNLEPCLSYSRFHLDELNLPAFLRSYLDGDAQDIDHGELLWNAAYELIRKLDEETDKASEKSKMNVEKAPSSSSARVSTMSACSKKSERHLRSLISLRHILHSLHLRGKDKAIHTWGILVDDIDVCISDFAAVHDLSGGVLHACLQKAVLRPVALPPRDPLSGQREGDNATIAALGPSVSFPPCARDSPSTMQGLIPESYACRFHSLASSSYFMANPEKFANEVSSTTIKTSEESDRNSIGSGGGMLRVGDAVIVRICRRQMAAIVRKIPAEDVTAVVVSYEDWPRQFDELQLLHNLRTAGGDDIASHDELKKDDVVLVCWGKEREQYRAVVRGVYRGKVVLVHYENSSDDWNQWVKPRQLVRRK